MQTILSNRALETISPKNQASKYEITNFVIILHPGRTIILILALTNHAINFFLYVLSSEKFRTELCVIGCGRRQLYRKDDDVKSMNTASSIANTEQGGVDGGVTKF